MISLNARVSAVCLVVGSVATLVLSMAPQLVALRFIALMTCTVGAWAFADEMGIGKPLNRAGLVAFAFAVVAKILVLLDVGNSDVAGGRLLYALMLLLALLLWSMAFLHRDGPLKVAGAIGASATIMSIVALVAGHIFVGVGAFWGIGSLYGQFDAARTGTPQIMSLIEIIFVAWSAIAGAALWTGKITRSPAQ